MMLLKNLGRHSLPPLRRISSQDLKLQDEVGRWLSVRVVTHRGRLVWLSWKNQLLVVIHLRCSEVLILLLGIQAIMYEMPGLFTVVAKAGWKVFGFGNLLLIFLDAA
jgi:hypothetical protein